jgi:hypothetical protein
LEMMAISPSSPGGPLAPVDVNYTREKQTHRPYNSSATHSTSSLQILI